MLLTLERFAFLVHLLEPGFLATSFFNIASDQRFRLGCFRKSFDIFTQPLLVGLDLFYLVIERIELGRNLSDLSAEFDKLGRVVSSMYPRATKSLRSSGDSVVN